MMRHLALIAALALSACGQTPPIRSVEVRTVTVIKPVPVACVKASDIPAMPPRIGDQLTGDGGHDVLIITASAVLLRQALREAIILLGGCSKG